MIGVIADDLTGAAELGAVGLRYGLRAEVVVGVGAGHEYDLVCVDTDSRSAAPQKAGRRVATATHRLGAAGASWIYKKVDSVLRGPVAVELETVMHQLGLHRVLLVPANPALGRVIRDGCYFIGEKPIHETDFRCDPEHPRHSPQVRELLRVSGSLPVWVGGLHDPLPANGIVVGECETSAELRQWAGRWNDSMLAAGGAEFFAALLESTGHVSPRASACLPAASGAAGELFVCGSISEACRAFVTRSRDRGVPVFCLPEESALGRELAPSGFERLAELVEAALQTHPRVILTVGLPLVREHRVGQQLASHLTRIAATVLRRAPVGHICVEGGATAISLARRMRWRRLKVRCEVAPGVVALQPAGEVSCLVTLKPGSYVWPEEVDQRPPDSVTGPAGVN